MPSINFPNEGIGLICTIEQLYADSKKKITGLVTSFVFPGNDRRDDHRF